MIRHFLILATVVATSTPASAKIAASLKVSADQKNLASPYRIAELTIDNGSDNVIGNVSLGWRDGGPRMIYNVTVPPQNKQMLKVALPATSPHQVYAIKLFQQGNQMNASLDELTNIRAEISWPVELVNTATFIDPRAYHLNEFDLPAWSVKLKRTVLTLAVLTAIALTGTMLLHRPVARLAILAVIATCSTGAAAGILAKQEIVFQNESVGTNSKGEPLISLTCRRTTQWTLDDGRFWPIYFSRRQMEEDRLTIHPDSSITLQLNPHELRLFRRTNQTTTEK